MSMIYMNDVYRVIDEEKRELERQIRAQAEVMDLDDSQMKGMDDLFTIIDQFGKAVLARLDDLETERLDRMAEDMTEVKE